MKAKDCKSHCCTFTTQTGGTDQLSFDSVSAVGVYAAPFVDAYPSEPPSFTWTKTEEQDVEDEFFEMRSDKEVRQLLNEVFLWMSGMGEYPDLLAQLCPEEIVGDTESEDEDERTKVRERTVAQVLRWVLGEL